MADYRGYVTAAGQQFEALAKQMHYPVKIGFIEIGDGTLPDNESPISRTSLVHKTKQFPAIVEQDPDRPGEWIAKCHIPADDAINGQGYFIREMGCKLVDQGDGVLYAYRRISNDWKPLITEGEAKSFIYILRFIPSNGELIKPTINPSVVYVDKQELERRFLQHANEGDPHSQYAKTVDVNKSLEKKLSKEQNGADIPDKPQFIKNLQIDDGLLPVGVPFPWPLATPPAGWLKCNGASFDKSRYPKLALAYPSGVLPDLRGEFIYGWDDGRGVNPGRALLSWEAASTVDHIHEMTSWTGDSLLSGKVGGSANSIFGISSSSGDGGQLFSWKDGIGTTDNKKRIATTNHVRGYGNGNPRNFAFLYIVKGA